MIQVSDGMQPSYSMATLSSQGKVRSMKSRSTVEKKQTNSPGQLYSNKTATVVTSTSVYKDNKIFKCPVCKDIVGLEHFLPGYNVTSSKHTLTEKTTTDGFYQYSNMD